MDKLSQQRRDLWKKLNASKNHSEIALEPIGVFSVQSATGSAIGWIAFKLEASLLQKIKALESMHNAHPLVEPVAMPVLEGMCSSISEIENIYLVKNPSGHLYFELYVRPQSSPAAPCAVYRTEMIDAFQWQISYLQIRAGYASSPELWEQSLTHVQRGLTQHAQMEVSGLTARMSQTRVELFMLQISTYFKILEHIADYWAKNPELLISRLKLVQSELRELKHSLIMRQKYEVSKHVAREEHLFVKTVSVSRALKRVDILINQAQTVDTQKLQLYVEALLFFVAGLWFNLKPWGLDYFFTTRKANLPNTLKRSQQIEEVGKTTELSAQFEYSREVADLLMTTYPDVFTPFNFPHRISQALRIGILKEHRLSRVTASRVAFILEQLDKQDAQQREELELAKIVSKIEQANVLTSSELASIKKGLNLK